MTEENGEERGLPHFASRLNVLFLRVPRRGRTEFYSNDKAAEELRAGGVSVTGAYLSQLRTGKRNNPSGRLVAAIADLFEVPVSYFFDAEQATRVEAQLDTLVAFRSAGVRELVTRMAGVSDTGIANLAAILEHLRRIEGLP